MYRTRTIAVVIPVHNEEELIADTIKTVPQFVDTIILVDDGSSDGTRAAIAGIEHEKIQVIRHDDNRGVGAATISGYRRAAALGFDIVAVMDGDGQMHPDDLPALLDAIIDRGLDYAKGNRFLHHSITAMPRLRYLGNRILSALTRQAAGLEVALDAQCGYAAITSRALRELELDKLYPRYGFLNELIMRLAVDKKIGSVPVRTIYGREVSGINPFITIPTICLLVARGYMRRRLSWPRAHKQTLAAVTKNYEAGS